jgi:hypothetical protein
MMYNVHRGIYSYEIKTHVKSILGEFWENMKAIAKKNKLEAQWAEPVSLTFHFALRKLYTGTRYTRDTINQRIYQDSSTSTTELILFLII